MIQEVHIAMYRLTTLFVVLGICLICRCQTSDAFSKPTSGSDMTQFKDSFFLKDLRRGNVAAIQDFLNYHTFLDTPVDILRQFLGIDNKKVSNQNPEFSDLVRRLILSSDNANPPNKVTTSSRTREHKTSDIRRENGFLGTGSEFVDFLKRSRLGLQQQSVALGGGDTAMDKRNSRVPANVIPGFVERAPDGIASGTQRAPMNENGNSINQIEQTNDRVIERVGRLSGLQTNIKDNNANRRQTLSGGTGTQPNVLPDDDKVMRFIDNILTREGVGASGNGTLRLDFPAADFDNQGNRKQTLNKTSSNSPSFSRPGPPVVNELSLQVGITDSTLNHAADNTITNRDMIINSPSIFKTTKRAQTAQSEQIKNLGVGLLSTAMPPRQAKNTIILHWPEIVNKPSTTEATVRFVPPNNDRVTVTKTPITVPVTQTVSKSTEKQWQIDSAERILHEMSLDTSVGQNLAAASIPREQVVDHIASNRNTETGDTGKTVWVIPRDRTDVTLTLPTTQLPPVAVKTAGNTRNSPINVQDIQKSLTENRPDFKASPMSNTIKATQVPFQSTNPRISNEIQNNIQFKVDTQSRNVQGKWEDVTPTSFIAGQGFVLNKNVENPSFGELATLETPRLIVKSDQLPAVQQNIEVIPTSGPDNNSVFSNNLLTHDGLQNTNVHNTRLQFENTRTTPMTTNLMGNKQKTFETTQHVVDNYQNDLQLFENLLKRWYEIILQTAWNNMGNMFLLFPHFRNTERHVTPLPAKNNQMNNVERLQITLNQPQADKSIMQNVPNVGQDTNSGMIKSEPTSWSNTFDRQSMSLFDFSPLPDLPTFGANFETATNTAKNTMKETNIVRDTLPSFPTFRADLDAKTHSRNTIMKETNKVRDNLPDLPSLPTFGANIDTKTHPEKTSMKDVNKARDIFPNQPYTTLSLDVPSTKSPLADC